ncbi:MAG: hypothetical protein OEY28_07295 [Nitrospira sp.]|nr:hypothetical protein [Nitrospira sp.]
MKQPLRRLRIRTQLSRLFLVSIALVLITQDAKAEDCIDKAKNALQGQYLLLEENPQGTGDYIKNTLFFPFGLLISGLVVVQGGVGPVLLPGDCYKDSSLKSIDDQNLRSLQSIEESYQGRGRR